MRALAILVLVVGACSSGYGTTHPIDAAIDAPSSQKDLTAFGIVSPAETGTIDPSSHAIAVRVPFGTDPSALIATFMTTGATVKVGGVVQTSGVTPNDFRTPVVYAVGAVDGTTQSYTVTVTVAPNSATALMTFGFANPQATGVIDEADKTIAILVPFGTVTTSLIASYTTMAKSVLVNGVAQTQRGVDERLQRPGRLHDRRIRRHDGDVRGDRHGRGEHRACDHELLARDESGLRRHGHRHCDLGDGAVRDEPHDARRDVRARPARTSA